MRRDLGVNQSRQTALDEVRPRSENAGEKICKKGLDNSGNIEGNSNDLFHRLRAQSGPAACSCATVSRAQRGQRGSERLAEVCGLSTQA